MSGAQAVEGPGTVGRALDRLRAGGIVVVVDDEDRENEGDLVMAAQYATPESVAFFLQYTSGYLCVPVTEDRARELALEAMVENNTESHRTAFLVTVDYRPERSSGVSAADRARTITALADPDAVPKDFARPGHVLPLQGRPGGVLRRAGHTEASIDLCALAGLRPAALICELITADRTGMMRAAEISRFSATHDLPVLTIAELVRWRHRSEQLVARCGEEMVSTAFGVFRAVAFRSLVDSVEHLALVAGNPQPGTDVLVRVHSECVTGEVLGSLRCDCGPQLHVALARIAAEGTGVLVYLRGHEGRGIGLGQKLRAYQLQETGMDTVDANLALGLPVDSREYGVGAQILVDLGVSRLRLMTNNPAKFGGLAGFGLTIVGRVPLEIPATAQSRSYLLTKRERMGHQLGLELGHPS